LTEDSPHEIPVAKALVTLTSRRAAETTATTEDVDLSFRRLSLFEPLLIGRVINAN